MYQFKNVSAGRLAGLPRGRRYASTGPIRAARSQLVGASIVFELGPSPRQSNSESRHHTATDPFRQTTARDHLSISCAQTDCWRESPRRLGDLLIIAIE